MTCFSPFVVSHPKAGRKLAFLGKYSDLGAFDPPASHHSFPRKYLVPCGKCVGCRYDKAAEWSVRAQCEARYHSRSCFLTLTYSDANLPPGRSLCRRHVELFLKRLRKRYGLGIKVMFCGEYGPRTLRPHYHMLVFGWQPSAASLSRWRVSTAKKRSSLFLSTELASLWPHGHTLIGMDAAAGAAGYVARYSLKKTVTPYFDAEVDTGSDDRHVPRYKKYALRVTRTPAGDSFPFLPYIDDSLGYSVGEFYDEIPNEFVKVEYLEPEFHGYSRGLGARYVCDFSEFLLSNGYLRLPDGRTTKIPKYFHILLDRYFPASYSFMKRRLRETLPVWPSPEELEVKKTLFLARVRSVVRPDF